MGPHTSACKRSSVGESSVSSHHLDALRLNFPCTQALHTPVFSASLVWRLCPSSNGIIRHSKVALRWPRRPYQSLGLAGTSVQNATFVTWFQLKTVAMGSTIVAALGSAEVAAVSSANLKVTALDSTNLFSSLDPARTRSHSEGYG